MKKVIIVLTSMLVLVTGYFGYIVVSDFLETAEKKQSVLSGEASANIEDTRKNASGNMNEEEIEELEEQGLNPFGSTKSLDELTDSDYQEYIHGMSHQKVKASEKWGFYKITSDRINWLVQVLEEADLKNESGYKEILEKWQKGDFSTVDHDHNTIWRMQDGTIGKATGILSPEEEEAYLERKN